MEYNLGFIILMILILVFELALFALLIVSMWKIYVKTNNPGWASIIPIYNILVLLEIVKKPWWWLFLMMIPYVGLIWAIWAINLLVKSFGKDEGFTVGCIFLPFVFFPILAFGKSQFLGQKIDINPDIIDTNLV